jgi:hypothetical protein
MIVALFYDPMQFTMNLYNTYEKPKPKSISVEGFNMFEESCLKFRGRVPVITFNKQLAESFDVIREIKKTIYFGI